MTIKKRLAHSNIIMFVIPVLVAAILLLIGMGICLVLLERVWLPQLGVSLWELHQTGEQIEHLLSGSAAILCVYAGAVMIALLLTIAWTNFYLTRSLFRHISDPLDTLAAGVARIRDGDLEHPIAYAETDEFKTACDAMDEMAARLKASLEQQQLEQQKKQELIAGMSHDLKSPLTAIRAYTEALLDGIAQEEAVKQRYLQTIHKKEMEIETLTNRLFAFAKMNVIAFPVHREPLPLHQTMQELTDEWDTEEMTITLEIPNALCVMADRELLHRIMANLLSNSRKYAEQKRIDIQISAIAMGDMAEITFADNGVGVPQEQLSKLSDVFFRGDAARTAPETGSGLGLSVVKKAVTEMGGSVCAENGEQDGLRIVFTLPIVKKEENDV